MTFDESARGILGEHFAQIAESPGEVAAYRVTVSVWDPAHPTQMSSFGVELNDLEEARRCAVQAARSFVDETLNAIQIPVTVDEG